MDYRIRWIIILNNSLNMRKMNSLAVPTVKKVINNCNEEKGTFKRVQLSFNRSDTTKLE